MGDTIEKWGGTSKKFRPALRAGIVPPHLQITSDATASGFRNCRPDDVELTANTFVMWRTAPLHLDDYLKLICFLSTSVYSALGVSAIMRYINRRFTYLLTYLLPLPINPVWWGLMHAISSYHGNRLTPAHAHKQTNKQTRSITIHCVAASLARSVIRGC